MGKLSDYFNHSSKKGTAPRLPLSTPNSLTSVKSHPRGFSPFRFRTVRSFYFFFLLFLAVIISVEFESYARDIATVPRENISLKLQSIIIFLGSGKSNTKKPPYPLGESKGYPFSGKYDNVSWAKEEIKVKQTIPVVFIARFPNARTHPQVHVLKQWGVVINVAWSPNAVHVKYSIVGGGVHPFMMLHVCKHLSHGMAKKQNDLVYILGSSPSAHRLLSLGVRIEGKEKFYKVSKWINKTFHSDKMEILRWWWLKDFMERHNFSKVFYANPYGMLFTNVSESMTWMYPDTDVALPLRWPSMQPPLLPNQYVTTSLSIPFAYFSYEGLKDVLDFWKKAWDMDLFGVKQKAGRSQIRLQKSSTLPPTVTHAPPLPLPRPSAHSFREYTDAIMFAWYAYSECWTNPALNPPCMAEDGVGISDTLARKIRGNFVPKFHVHSLCQPRKCQATEWSEKGLCTFDYNFSVLSPLRVFKFRDSDKCPTSMFYEFYEIWRGKRQEEPVQFLGVHFLGNRKQYLSPEVIHPIRTFGASRN